MGAPGSLTVQSTGGMSLGFVSQFVGVLRLGAGNAVLTVVPMSKPGSLGRCCRILRFSLVCLRLHRLVLLVRISTQ
jgi:hypothetical protein